MAEDGMRRGVSGGFNLTQFRDKGQGEVASGEVRVMTTDQFVYTCVREFIQYARL